MSTTVVHYSGVVYNAADMQTQSTVTDDKSQTYASHHNTFVNNDIINDEKIFPPFGVSKEICSVQTRSRYVVTNNGHVEGSRWHYVDERTVKIFCFISPSNCDYGSQYAAQFPEGIIIIYMKIISLYLECSNEAAQYNSGGNGTSQKPVYAGQETESDVQLHLHSSLDFITDK